MSSLRAATLNKRLNIQRRLAWSLCKDDTQNRREAKPFFSPLTVCVFYNVGNAFIRQQRERILY